MFGKEIGNYILDNKIALIVQIILGIIFLIIPFIITGKRNGEAHASIQNNTSIVQVKAIVQQLLIYVDQRSHTTIVHPPAPSVKSTSSENDS